MKLEMLIVILSNIRSLCVGVSLISAIVFIVSLIAVNICETTCASYTDEEKTKSYNYREYMTWHALWARGYRTSMIFFLIAILPAMSPSLDDLWKVRINLIKLELASPENVSKGVSEISRIAKELENKYLTKDK